MGAKFTWTEKTTKAALGLAEGKTEISIAAELGITDRTIRNWKNIPEFAHEVDKLSLMMGVAVKAERLRIANRMIAKLGDRTEKDILDWLKYAQSETDGIKLNLTQSLLNDASDQMAGSGPARMAGTAQPD